MAMWSAIGGAVGSLFGPLGTAGGTAIGSYFDNKKVTGVPTPAQRSGSEIGADYKGFLDQAYPGTTPWERLGANSPMGAIQSAENTAKNAFEMQKRDLVNKTTVADQTNRAHIITALGSLSPQAAQQGLDMLDFRSPGFWDSQTQQHREKLQPELSKLDADTKKTVADTTLTTEKTPEATLRGKIAQGALNIFDGVGSAARFAGTKYAQAEQKISDIKAKTKSEIDNLVYNRGAKPRRFSR